MGRLIYSAIASLDGYIEDEDGRFDWSTPDEQLHSFVNERERQIGTHLLGRRMTCWHCPARRATGLHPRVPELWRAAEKIVYSRTLAPPSAARTRIEREFDPAAVEALKRGSKRDLAIGGPEVAAHAFRGGLVDEVELFLSPIAVGGGKRCLPAGVRIDLNLLEQHRFAGGAVQLRYRVRL